jgi:hypothetical protein
VRNGGENFVVDMSAKTCSQPGWLPRSDDPQKALKRSASGVQQIASRSSVNDWICQRAEGSAVFICECSSHGCLATLELTVREYEEIRSNPTWAILNHGHEHEGMERVIQRGSGVLITGR